MTDRSLPDVSGTEDLPWSWLTGPTVLRIVVGTQLRRLREANGLTCDQAGRAIRASPAKISRIELGRVPFKARDLADLLTFYGVHETQERAQILDLAAQAGRPGWWRKYDDVLPSWFQSYVGLEEAASLIRTYQVQFMPGLLQTEDYARAVVRLGHPDDPERDIEQRVALRLRRQQVLRSDEGPTLWAAVDEGALRRPIGGREVQRAQLQHLMELAERPRIVLQIVPFALGGHVAAGGPFTILRFPVPELPDVVYLEQLTSALYLDAATDVDHYMSIMDRLCAQIEPPERTVALLESIRGEL